MSQLDLALRAGFSSRHVSFIETGRTQPSRQAVLILAEALDVPLRERNRRLEAGGFAHVYRQTALGAEARRWIVNWEEVERHLLGRAERERGHAADDDVAKMLLEERRGYVGPPREKSPAMALKAADVLLPIHIRMDGIELRLFSTIMTLGTPQDITLQELRVETFFPADEESEAAWMRMTRQHRRDRQSGD